MIGRSLPTDLHHPRRLLLARQAAVWGELIDMEAALQTASAIGDDRLQRQAQGYVVPDAFTHGSSQHSLRGHPPNQ